MQGTAALQAGIAGDFAPREGQGTAGTAMGTAAGPRPALAEGLRVLRDAIAAVIAARHVRRPAKAVWGKPGGV